MAGSIIFAEGSRKTDNGDLRNGFGRLLRQAGLRRMPQVVMCDDTHGAIRKFNAERSNPRSAFHRILLLVDLDGPSSSRTTWLATYNLTACANDIFFMVQKMEAWFLAQPALLSSFYQPKLIHAPPRTPPQQIIHPDRVLMHCTTGHRKGAYHKTGHGALLLAQSQLAILQTVFPDVAQLIKAL